MAKTDWESFVTSALHKLKVMEAEEKNFAKIKIIRNDIFTLQKILLQDEDVIEVERTTNFEEYQKVKIDIERIDFFWDDFKKFIDLTTPCLPELPKEPNIQLSNNDILTLTHDFFKTLTPIFYDNFMKYFEESRKNIFFRPKKKGYDEGDAYFIKSLNIKCSIINRTYTINDLLTNIHESCHITSDLICDTHLSKKKYLFNEIDPIFMELIASNFITKMTNNDAGILSRAHLHNYYSGLAINTRDKISLFEYEQQLPNGFINNNQLNAFATEKLFITKKELHDILSIPNNEDEAYLISYIYAVELYELYMLDPEKALSYLESIIYLSSTSSYYFYENIKQIGITPNENMQAYHQNLQKEAMILSKKRVNNEIHY